MRKNLDDSVELDVVIITSPRELNKVPASLRSVLVVHLRSIKIVMSERGHMAQIKREGRRQEEQVPRL